MPNLNNGLTQPPLMLGIDECLYVTVLHGCVYFSECWWWCWCDWYLLLKGDPLHKNYICIANWCIGGFKHHIKACDGWRETRLLLGTADKTFQFQWQYTTTCQRLESCDMDFHVEQKQQYHKPCILWLGHVLWSSWICTIWADHSQCLTWSRQQATGLFLLE